MGSSVAHPYSTPIDRANIHLVNHSHTHAEDANDAAEPREHAPVRWHRMGSTSVEQLGVRVVVGGLELAPRVVTQQWRYRRALRYARGRQRRMRGGGGGCGGQHGCSGRERRVIDNGPGVGERGNPSKRDDWWKQIVGDVQLRSSAKWDPDTASNLASFRVIDSNYAAVFAAVKSAIKSPVDDTDGGSYVVSILHANDRANDRAEREPVTISVSSPDFLAYERANGASDVISQLYADDRADGRAEREPVTKSVSRPICVAVISSKQHPVR